LQICYSIVCKYMVKLCLILFVIIMELYHIDKIIATIYSIGHNTNVVIIPKYTMTL